MAELGRANPRRGAGWARATAVTRGLALGTAIQNGAFGAGGSVIAARVAVWLAVKLGFELRMWIGGQRAPRRDRMTAPAVFSPDPVAKQVAGRQCR